MGINHDVEGLHDDGKDMNEGVNKLEMNRIGLFMNTLEEVQSYIANRS